MNRLSALSWAIIIVVFSSQCRRARHTLLELTVFFSLRYPIHWLRDIRDYFRSASCHSNDLHHVSLLSSRLCGLALEPLYRWLLRCLVAIRRCIKCHNDTFRWNTSSGKSLYEDNCGRTTYSRAFHSECGQSHARLHGDYLWHLQEYSTWGSDFQARIHAHAWEKSANVFESIVAWQSSLLYVCPFSLSERVGSI